MNRILKDLLAAACAVMLVAIFSIALIHLQPPVSAQSTSGWAFDPCTASFIAKTTKVINLSGAGTTEIAPTVAGKSWFMCSFSVTHLGVATTAATFQLESGTKSSTACDTGAAAMTGAYSGGTVAGAIVALFSNDRLTTPVGSELCAVTTSASASVQGVITLVSQ